MRFPRILHRTTLVLAVTASTLLLRADGCVTGERELDGVLAIALRAEWTTAGSTEASATRNGNAGDFADEIFAALDDADLSAVQAALDAGRQVTVAGMRAEITRSEGHDAARTASISVDTGSGSVLLGTMSIPDNRAGRVVTPADGGLAVSAAGVSALETVARSFLGLYLQGTQESRLQARTLLNSVQWSAAWTSTPAPTPTQPDDFDWFTEVILHVPATYALDSIGG